MNQHEIFIEKITKLAKTYNDKTAIAFLREGGMITTTSYGDILSGCSEMKKMLDKSGVVAGDRVAIVSPHSPQAVLASLGLEYSNITVVLIDASLPHGEINRLLKFADVRAVFVTERLYFVIEQENKAGIPIYKLCDKESKYELFPDSDYKVTRTATADPEKDVIAVLFSSGTTASMKGIKVTYKSVMMASEIFVRNVKWKSTYKYLHVFPLNHIAGFATIHAFLSCGSELGMIENMTPDKLLGALLDYEPDGFGMIPKVFEMMEDKIRETIRQKGKLAEGLILFLLNFSGCMRKNFGINVGKKIFPFITRKVFGRNIRTIGTGASLCRASTSKFFIDLGLNWANFYASTETNVPAVSTGVFDRYPVLMAGNIKRNPEIEVYIHNPNQDGIGEIYIKSELIMKGYFRDDELTESSFDNEYFKTGDYGYVDKKDNLYVTGRVKESILLHNGKKVSPTDVENYYKERITQVEMACCGCLKENSNYDEVYMFVQTSGMENTQLMTIVSELRELSSGASQLYKLDHIEFIEKLPLTSVGKVKRFELQKKALLERDLADGQTYQDSLNSSVEEKVIQLVCKVMGREEIMNSDTRIKEDLGLDSLGIYGLQTEIEICYGINFLNEWSKIITISDLVKCIEKKQSVKLGRSVEEDECYLAKRSKKDIQNVKQLVRVLNGICKVQYKGLENLIDKPCILVANHNSHLDIMCVYKAMILKYGYKHVYKMCCLAAKELVQQRGMEKVFHALGAIPVERKGNAAMALVTLNKYIRENGYSAVVFPEGTRSRSGKMGRFTHGAASSAITTGVPIIPIGISGSYQIWPATRNKPFFSWKKKTVKVSIGKPIYPTTSDVSELTELIRVDVEELCKEN
ncbi:MAG: AMP-binding protein [Lachnospiraceae bacterium]